MDRSGTTVPAVTGGELKEVATWPGPFLSVFLTIEQAVAHPAEHARQSWSPIRRRLVAEGAEEAMLEVVDALVPEAHLEGRALGVVVGGGGRVLVEYDGEPITRDLGRFGSSPTLTPFVSWRQKAPPYVVVLTDRTGADLVGVTRSRPPEELEAGGDDWRISKPRAGGYAHWSLQRRVEETWARNARSVAAGVEHLVTRVGARLVAVAGEPHARSLLREELPRRVDELVEVVEGGRAPDGSGDRTGDAVARLVASVAAEDSVAALEKLKEELGESARAVAGAAGTLDAIRQARADVVLVHDDPAESNGPTASFSRKEPALCALDPDDLVGLGPEPASGSSEIEQGRLVDVAVRAGLLTGAGVRTVPLHGGPAEGLGALLRWAA